MAVTFATEIIPLSTDQDGVIRVANTRVTLDTLVGAFSVGATAEEIVQKYLSLKLADVYQVIGYYLRRPVEFEVVGVARDGLIPFIIYPADKKILVCGSLRFQHHKYLRGVILELLCGLRRPVRGIYSAGKGIARDLEDNSIRSVRLSGECTQASRLCFRSFESLDHE